MPASLLKAHYSHFPTLPVFWFFFYFFTPGFRRHRCMDNPGDPLWGIQTPLMGGQSDFFSAYLRLRDCASGKYQRTVNSGIILSDSFLTRMILPHRDKIVTRVNADSQSCHPCHSQTVPWEAMFKAAQWLLVQDGPSAKYEVFRIHCEHHTK